MNEHYIEGRINLTKQHLRGKIVAAIASIVGDVTAVNLTQVSELVESCDAAMRYQEELSAKVYCKSDETP